jgi:hypothetical protein
LKLTDLAAAFVRYQKDKEGRVTFRPVDTLAEAHGVKFLCPKCFAANGGPRGTHTVVCWSESAGTPKGATPGPGRWKMVGRDLSDLTLNADPPRTARSVQLLGGCEWHGFVTNGEAA